MPLEDRVGHSTYWETFGHGARPALAIHCSLAHSGAWSGVAGRLADRITLTAFDLPGHGRSGDWSGEGDGLTRATEIAASFVQGRVDLIGHSFGAVVALRLAIAAREAIRTLTLIEPVLFAAAMGDPEWDNHLKETAEFGRAMAEADRNAAAAAFTDLWGTGVDWQKLNEESRREVTARIHLITATHPALFEDSGGILAPGALERLDMPVLLIRGDRSPSIVERIAENIAARLPDVGIATVPGAGHMVPVTHPHETAGLIGVNLDRG
ncbi:Pimeloyl-[acyl-carrier protein] methyl ester esterase [Defluviimonas aquaemixtae]|uniref:Pimeloyl-[acyl-carrier protein] methyl ester esterase n=1 Tax=Albidovulum aquaemixtae TaxID=1542388 RepID=A0A2R8BN20_9RHOB|nr:alpha/beta hydrolase [Defluviimonas aquaemixtae]SPH24750.1 Pimeloyl-[acyl-carrier protein] methyl ester esterase [Defluviimonas aquaemixtae]